VLIEGGSDTTSAYIQSLILALIAYPESQKKAQEEIDRVVGEHRMPTLDDLDQMPYIRSMILEVGISAIAWFFYPLFSSRRIDFAPSPHLWFLTQPWLLKKFVWNWLSEYVSLT
jgi:hypothetical protein